jgi:hypothetical protein
MCGNAGIGAVRFSDVFDESVDVEGVDLWVRCIAYFIRVGTSMALCIGSIWRSAGEGLSLPPYMMECCELD